MQFHSRTDNTKDDWMTPDYIYTALGEFDLDPCANTSNPTRVAKRGYTVEDDGLSKDWFGRVWLNPPYGRACKLWMERMSDHCNGVALIVPRTGSKWFKEFVFDRADAILFLTGRVQFISSDSGKVVKGNNADSCLVAFGESNVEQLHTCNLNGKFLVL